MSEITSSPTYMSRTTRLITELRGHFSWCVGSVISRRDPQRPGTGYTVPVRVVAWQKAGRRSMSTAVPAEAASAGPLAGRSQEVVR